MGQAVRAMKYDRAANERNAIPALEFVSETLQWHRLDDGVMGGKSETVHHTTTTAEEGNSSTQQQQQQHLHFCGTINTEGGGFASIRAPIPSGGGGIPENTIAIKLKLRGDGKTYKVLLSDGEKSTGNPFSRSPSWQMDVPTKKKSNNDDADDDEWEEVTLPLDGFQPSFGGSTVQTTTSKLVATEIHQVGLMLSLKLSNGEPNPPETFGEGIFDFSLLVASLTPVMKENE